MQSADLSASGGVPEKLSETPERNTDRNVCATLVRDGQPYTEREKDTGNTTVIRRGKFLWNFGVRFS